MVLDSRQTMESVRRRRKCSECKRRFTTYEQTANPSIRVVKRSGASEAFDSRKIDLVIQRITKNRSGINTDKSSRLSRMIEAAIVDEGTKTIPTWTIATRLLDLLKPLDSVAYNRLQANYLDEDGKLRLEKAPKENDNEDQLPLFEEPLPEKK